MVLNGTEVGWTSNTMTNTCGYRITNFSIKSNTGNSNLTGDKTNYFKEITPNQSWNGNTDLKGFCITTDNNLRINFGDTTNKLNDFLSWLGTHNLNFYYVLANPIEEEITEPTLINQLNTIKYGAESYYGQTNIMITSEELQPILKVQTMDKIV